ncbi:MAG: hypothetical protein GXP33_14165 [Spirochaetes bacterium]|nr:hypothetical protein [Spirochaetota bacterium]
MKKGVFLFIILSFPLIQAVPDTLEGIDQVVDRISAYITTNIMDRQSYSISVETFLPDNPEDGESDLLGRRISGLLEIRLAELYRNVTITHVPDAGVMFTISGEIQIYREKVRIVVRIIKADGSLIGGMNVDLDRSPGINALIHSSSNQDAEEQPPPIDPFEPDDNPGFEVEIRPEGISTFDRSLTDNDTDRFIFQLKQKESVTISAIADIDIRILLFREGEEFPYASNDNSSPESSSKLTVNPDKGIYIIEITGLTPYTTGPYKLIVDFTHNSNDGSKSGNKEKQAEALKSGETQKHTIAPDDTDWILIAPAKPGFYSIVLRSAEAVLSLSVYNDAGNKYLFKETGSKPGVPVTAGLFLGIMPVKIKVEMLNSGIQPAEYSVTLNRLKVDRIYPDGKTYHADSGNAPAFFLLRIINTGTYRINYRNAGLHLEIFALPQLLLQEGIRKKEKPLQVIYNLSSGDYLVRIMSSSAAGSYLSINGE